MVKFNTDFDFFWDLITKGINFTFTRYADGEVMLMKGIQVNEATQAFSIDKWKAPTGLTKVGNELLSTLNHTEDNYYYAISSKTDNMSDYEFLKTNIKQDVSKLTFVNLWINANYLNMKRKLCSNNREVILICNEEAKIDNFPFNVIDIAPFPNDCINFWEVNGDEYIKKLIEKYSTLSNQLFYISCGPISEIIIHKLYEANPNNTYIDVGSSIDEFVHGRVTRPYMNPTSIYSKMISSF